MTYYHVVIGLKSRPHKGVVKENLLEQDLMNNIVKPYIEGEPFRCRDDIVSPDDVSYMKITESEQMIRPSMSLVSDYFANLWQLLSQQKDVTDKFLKIIPQRKRETVKETTPFSKNVFIVHGRDHEPMKELKTMLYEFGLNPIVLHEKESEGSLTLAEKLEEYSEHVGYAFVILTPDDFGCEKTEVEKTISELSKKEFTIVRNWFDLVFKGFKLRARQNVIFEMGYFWGLLKRKRVCCLIKGDVEKPSDIEGIVYIPFKDSVKEVQIEIIKKLTKAGYEIKM